MTINTVPKFYTRVDKQLDALGPYIVHGQVMAHTD